MLEAHQFIDHRQEPSASNTTKPAKYTVELTFDDRQKSRHKAMTQCGEPIGWFIERGHVLKDGDFLVATNGELIHVVAAQESVSTVYAKTTLELTRAAYHLGNRHVPLQITNEFLRYQHDHVLDEMIVGLGLHVECESAPFQPEPGAYAKGHAHGHSHDHGHGHSHSHSHGHDH